MEQPKTAEDILFEHVRSVHNLSSVVDAMEEYATQKNRELIDGGQKLEGILANIRYQTDYLPDFYYEWIDKVFNETDELFKHEEDLE